MDLCDNNSSYEYQGYIINVLKCRITDLESALEKILEAEKNGIWIQLIPCQVVVDPRQIIYAINTAIDSWVKSKNIAKKLNLEVLLRILGKRQIKEALKLFNELSKSNFWVIIIYNKGVSPRQTNEQNHVSELIGNFCMKNNVECRYDLDTILRIFSIDLENLRKESNFRAERMEEVLLKSILERITINLLD